MIELKAKYEINRSGMKGIQGRIQDFEKEGR